MEEFSLVSIVAVFEIWITHENTIVRVTDFGYFYSCYPQLFFEDIRTI